MNVNDTADSTGSSVIPPPKKFEDNDNLRLTMLSKLRKKIPPRVAPKPKKHCYDFASSMIYERENTDYLATSDKVPTSFRGLNKDQGQHHGLQNILNHILTLPGLSWA